MSVDFAKEIDEFIDSLVHSADPGESVPKRLAKVATEFADLAGHLVDAIDSENRDAELPNLKNQLIAGVGKLVGKLDMPVWASTSLSITLPAVIPFAVDAAAQKSSAIEKARDEYVVPYLDAAILFQQEFRKGLAPDAPQPIQP